MKGTSIFIDRDLTHMERENNKCLMKIKSNILTIDKSKKKILLRRGKLYIDNQEFSYKNGSLWAEAEQGELALNRIYGNKLKNINDLLKNTYNYN